MLALGALDVWQSLIIEVIQQKIIVKVSFDLTRKFTNLSLENLGIHDAPELVNRFFEIVSLNKALSSLLMYGVTLALQLFFGLILLLFYHPLFLVFDLFIITTLLIVVLLPYKKGLESAQKECSQKHHIAAWLEELLMKRFLFRLNKHNLYALQETDKRVVSFLKIRNLHFKQLITHQIGFYCLSAFSSSLLLGLGGYLVINNQLSLGQLVAAEIVLGALIYAFKRFSVLLENYYDLQASKNKIESVLNLTSEVIKTDLNEIIFPIKTIKIKTKQGSEGVCALGSPLLVVLEQPQKFFPLAESILGFHTDLEISFFVNDTLCLEEHRRAMRKHSVLLKRSEWFAGSVYDNLMMNRPSELIEKLKELLNTFDLMDKIMHQAEGLRHIIYDWENFFTDIELIQLMVIRLIIAEPQLIIIDGTFDKLKHSQIDVLLAELMKLKQSLIIVITRNEKKFQLSNRLVMQ